MWFLKVISLCGLIGGAAAVRACELALVLAVDVSGSVDAKEYRLQMDGLAAGLRDGVVSEALVLGQAKVTLIQWSGAARQEVSIPWTTLSDFEAVEALAQRVETVDRPWRNYSTALGEALFLALTEFSKVPGCKRRVVDVSGDGLSNEGIEPRSIHAALTTADVTVNAIAIEKSEPDLTAYYFENVIRGEGAFVVPVSSFREYPEGIRRKLIREVARATAFWETPPHYKQLEPEEVVPVSLQKFAQEVADSAKNFQK